MSKVHYRVNISFKGTEYLGWQKQKDFSPTVQEKFESAAVKVFKSEEVKSIACGRTDTGVHAIKMTVKLQVPFIIEASGLIKAINSFLPKDIRVLTAELSEDFNPTFDALSREYIYLLTSRESLSPFEEDLIANFRSELDLRKMEEALSMFVGEHDFSNYMCVGSEPRTTVREIFSASVSFEESSFHGLIGSHFKITLEGSGFLKQMVRMIIGVVVNYSKGTVTASQIKDSLRHKSSGRLAAVAPAKGLYKSNVSY